MTQKPLLWVEVGARAVRERSKCGGGCGQSANVAWRLCGCVLSEKPAMDVWCRQLSLSGAPGCVRLCLRLCTAAFTVVNGFRAAILRLENGCFTAGVRLFYG